MSNVDSQKIISVLKSEIENYNSAAKAEDVGKITTLGDGVATIYGLQNAKYGELLEFENGTRGMVLNLEQKTVGCVLFGSDKGLVEGSTVKCTGQEAGVYVGQGTVGRVIDSLGMPIDGKGPIADATDYRPIEKKAPGVITRQEVSVPLMTGTLAIDSMFPIGRGQRELVIGDRQTGKTALTIDTVLNQKGQNVICIYVAIGQKASSVAKVVGTLTKYGAMDYTIVVTATAADPAPLQYIAPYTGATIGEHFMDEGKDVLIIYDDLSKQAQAYRAISLLLKRPPGREAYPGDVFYLHSKLLERACRRNANFGGGSMTALPIIETQAGDISAYIPTNVISITDGQIFLETDLFHSGQRPAVNVGLSVSRVGGKAQTKAMKAVCGSLRIDLSQYKEMEAFSQFSSDLDEATKAQLAYGKSLFELLKQPLYNPMPEHKQVILLAAASNKLMVDVDAKDMQAFKTELTEYIEGKYPDMVKSIDDTGKISDDDIAKILEAAKEFKSSR
ncbi:MAG: F0F1 ATP synthase subunit alpha [Oscillospiraceae bacterium]|nr:F0F1 ATP synthase subunit alpha [Oscillospiraceae bacterium]